MSADSSVLHSVKMSVDAQMDFNPVANEPGWSSISYNGHTAYSRPLLGSELMCDQFAVFYDGLAECCMGFQFTSLQTREVIADLVKYSYARLRYVCPIIAASLDYIHDDTLRSFVYQPALNADHVTRWAKESVIVMDHVDPEAFISIKNQTRLPYTLSDGSSQIIRCYLLLPSAENATEYSLFFHGSHTILDARPTFQAFSLLLQFMANTDALEIGDIPWGSEWMNLPVGPVTSTGGPQSEWGLKGSPMLKAIARIMSTSQPSWSLKPSRELAQVPGKPIRVLHIMTDTDSARLLRALKSARSSITHLFEASQALAIYSINPVPEDEAMDAQITWPQTIISIDRWRVPPYTSKNNQVISSHTLIPIQIPFSTISWSETPKKRLVQLMKRLRDAYSEFLSNPHIPHLMAVQLSLHPPREPHISRNPYATTITNLGVVEKSLLSSNEVEGSTLTSSPSFPVTGMAFGHRMTTHNPLTHVWTFGSRVHVQIEASDVWDRDHLQSYLDMIMSKAMEFVD